MKNKLSSPIGAAETVIGLILSPRWGFYCFLILFPGLRGPADRLPRAVFCRPGGAVLHRYAGNAGLPGFWEYWEKAGKEKGLRKGFSLRTQARKKIQCSQNSQ